MENETRDPRSDWFGDATRWSLVQLAGNALQVEVRNRALGELIETYRRPIERVLAVHARRVGLDDLQVEDFFGYLLEHGVLAKADPERGRFRQYVQKVARYFANTRAREARSRSTDPLDVEGDDGQESRLEFVAYEERAWTLGILEHALERLAENRSQDSQALRRYYLAAERADTATLAAERGQSLETFQRSLARARERLKLLIEDALHDGARSGEDYAAERAWLIGRLFEACPGLYGDGSA